MIPSTLYLILSLSLMACSPSLDLKPLTGAPQADTEKTQPPPEAEPQPPPEAEPQPPVSESTQQIVPQDSFNRPSFLRINEVLYDAPGDETDGSTFIELFGPRDADLAGYSLGIIDGASQKTVKSLIFGESHRLNAKGFFVVCDARTGNPDQSQITACGVVANFDLQNGPDALKVLDPEGSLLDRLCYGFETPETRHPNPLCEGNPAPDAAGGFSLSRRQGVDTDDNAADFFVASPSPDEMGDAQALGTGTEAVETVEEGLSGESHGETTQDPDETPGASEAMTPKVIISEVVTDPQHDWNDTLGGDGIPFNVFFGHGTIGSSDEWIEMKNLSDEQVSLKDWSLVFQDGSDESFVFSDETSALLFSDGGSVSGFNGRETLVLSNPPGDMKNRIDIFLFDESNALVDEVMIEDGDAQGAFDESIVFDEDKNARRDAASLLF